MLSCQHQLQDDRIYWKEALSLKKAGYHVVHIAIGKEQKDYISREGIRLIQLALPRYFTSRIINKLFKILSFKKDVTSIIFDTAAQIKADVYHFHDLEINKIGKELKNLPWKPLVVYDVHESYGDLIRGHSNKLFSFFYYPYSLFIEKWEANCAKDYDAIIATEPYVYERMKAILPSVKNCALIYNYSYFTPAIEVLKNTTKKYDAIYSGSISGLRGIFQIIEAAKLIAQSKPDFKVIIIGSFVNKAVEQDVTKKIKENNLASNVIIHAAVPFEQIHTYYLESRIGLCIVHPIKLYTNAVFIKLFEYMAFGLPIVCSNFGEVAEYVTNANAGLTVNPLEPKAIAAGITKILDDNTEYVECSKNGAMAVRDKYSWAQEETKLFRLYNTLFSSLH